MATPKNCLIIAGEKSGEEHCLSFFHELKIGLPEFQFWGVGGDQLEKEGFELIYHLKDFSSWGISEVINKVPFYFKALDQIEKEVEKRNCKVAILIDFQTFNMKLAKKLKAKGVKVLYYVAPQAWVWKEWRTKVLAKTVNTLFTIIPFEKKWFKERGVKQVVSVDHPLKTHYASSLPYQREVKELKNGFNLLLLPGSRNAEVKYLLPEFIKSAKYFKKSYHAKISLVVSSNINQNLINPYIDDVDEVYGNESLVEAMKKADLCLAASGTVTLATALFELPTIVCYKSSLLNEWIYRTFINYKWFFSLANIVHNKLVFPELLQEEVYAFNINNKILKWIESPSDYMSLISELHKTQNLIKGELESVSDFLTEKIKESYE